MSAASPQQGYQDDYAHVSWLLSRHWFRSLALLRRGQQVLPCSGSTSPYFYVALVLLVLVLAAAAVLNYIILWCNVYQTVSLV